jgi:hypothetical protein
MRLVCAWLARMGSVGVCTVEVGLLVCVSLCVCAWREELGWKKGRTNDGTGWKFARVGGVVAGELDGTGVQGGEK